MVLVRTLTGAGFELLRGSDRRPVRADRRNENKTAAGIGADLPEIRYGFAPGWLARARFALPKAQGPAQPIRSTIPTGYAIDTPGRAQPAAAAALALFRSNNTVKNRTK